ncbi:hypothetical protein [Brevundimonas sp. G8]|uniref:hypothetical protein n=1 Tax=Brevundimonas sp. G8 TaxID=1350776 RepID=UPI0012EEF4D5|nr:hypothetical protein [Brevundimonas sp. G8]VXB01969.1 conserved exported hypothetical protein [Brevundimonas sp. G8]
MIKTLSFAAAAFATVAMASPSFAQSFSPSSGSVSGSGSVTLSQTVSATCNVSVTASPLSATSAPIPTRSITPGSITCLAVAPTGAWGAAVVPGSTTSIALTIGANTVANDPCYGTVVVAWNNATNTATFNNNALPPINPTGRNCTIVRGSIRIPGLQIL